MTIKQRIAAKELVENGGSVASALRKAGYSEAIVKNPQKVTQSLGFTEVLETMGISEARLAQVLKEGLSATKLVATGKDGVDDSFLNIQPDFAVRHRYLETGLRLLGYGTKYDTNPSDTNDSIVIYLPEKLTETLG